MADRNPTRPSADSAPGTDRLPAEKASVRAKGGTTPNSPIDIEVEEAGEPAVAIEKAEEEALAKAVEEAQKGGD